jgi:ribosomal protein S18 acetylase RimI-like enzyme
LLLQASEALVTVRGYSQISLSVGVENPNARRLYERVGYAATGDAYNDVWNYEDAQGRLVRVEEMVVDLVKTLAAVPA